MTVQNPVKTKDDWCSMFDFKRHICLCMSGIATNPKCNIANEKLSKGQ